MEIAAVARALHGCAGRALRQSRVQSEMFCAKIRQFSAAPSQNAGGSQGDTSSAKSSASGPSAPNTPPQAEHAPPQQPQSNPSGDAKTHFGFRTVDDSEKSNLVAQVFHSVAGSYDMMNDVMSGGIHRVWKDRFVQMLDPYPGTAVVDVAGGTGDIAFRIAEHMRSRPHLHGKNKESRVLVCDINSSMLSRGKERSVGKEFAQEDLPLPDNSVDAYTIAFGIRNVTHIDRALREAHRVLVPGGRFLCLEFSQVRNPLLRNVYDAYSMQVIPVLGELLARDMPSYQYLVESIRRFPTQEAFASMIRDAGFRMVTHEDLTFGVAAIHSGFKLKE